MNQNDLGRLASQGRAGRFRPVRIPPAVQIRLHQETGRIGDAGGTRPRAVGASLGGTGMPRGQQTPASHPTRGHTLMAGWGSRDPRESQPLSGLFVKEAAVEFVI